jgi:hypothetical protein
MYVQIVEFAGALIVEEKGREGKRRRECRRRKAVEEEKKSKRGKELAS